MRATFVSALVCLVLCMTGCGNSRRVEEPKNPTPAPKGLCLWGVEPAPAHLWRSLGQRHHRRTRRSSVARHPDGTSFWVCHWLCQCEVLWHFQALAEPVAHDAQKEPRADSLPQRQPGLPGLLESEVDSPCRPAWAVSTVPIPTRCVNLRGCWADADC